MSWVKWEQKLNLPIHMILHVYIPLSIKWGILETLIISTIIRIDLTNLSHHTSWQRYTVLSSEVTPTPSYNLPVCSMAKFPTQQEDKQISRI